MGAIGWLLGRLAALLWAAGATTLAAFVFVLSSAHVDAGPPDDAVDAPVLIERPGCDASIVDPSAPSAPPAPSAGVDQRITVTVPATAILRLDAAGRVVAATTNTGCAPRPTDALHYRRADGTFEAMPPGSLATIAWTGDFTRSGVEVPQTP